MQNEIEVYRRHKNLKIAAAELGLNWQTLYTRLKRAGEPVTGDKLRYGTDRDRLGAMGEALFKDWVPAADDLNAKKFQAKYDFDVGAFKVDVKASKPHQLNKKYAAKSWAFSFKRQALIADFVCCFCLSEDKAIQHVLLVPKEFFVGLQTVSVSCDGHSKWLDYSIPASDLAEFFRAMSAEAESLAA